MQKDSKQDTSTNLGALNARWGVSSFGGVNNNQLKFNIANSSTTGVITEIGSSTFGFAVGDQFYTTIVQTGAGTYTAMGKYTFGANNSSSGYRSATMTLQNNNNQLTVDYPAISGSQPAIVYIFQKQ